MANLQNWPANLGIRIADTNDRIAIATFTPDRNFSLSYIRLLLLKVGAAGGSETLQCDISSQANDPSVVYTSSTAVTLASMSNATNFIGWQRFDFNGKVFHKQSTYYITLKLSNYTRVGESNFIAAVWDWPYSHHVNDTYGTSYWNRTALAFELYAKHYT